MLSIDVIRAAQSNDMAAVTEVINATEPTVARLARKASARLNNGNLVDEFSQAGRVAMWEALSRFTGDSEAEFFGFVIRTVESTLHNAVRDEKTGGAVVDKDAVWVYSTMLVKADGDPYLAEKLAQTEPKAGARLSADRAHAARLAYRGSVSLDAGDEDGGTLADTLVAPQDETPDVVRPKVGRGAALEALSVLERYVTTPRDAQTRVALLAALENPTTADEVAVIEDAVKVPSDPQKRRYVLDAVAILRSFVSTATEGEVADDLRDVADDRKDERAAKAHLVHTVLNSMGELARKVLCHSFGIDGATYYGTGKDGDTEGLAAELGRTTVQVTDTRKKATAAFVKRYVAHVALTDEVYAAELLAGHQSAKRFKVSK